MQFALQNPSGSAQERSTLDLCRTATTFDFDFDFDAAGGVKHHRVTAACGRLINLASQIGWVVIYCYPMTGRPGQAIPGGWASIPGAGGCTPRSGSFRDSHDEIKSFGASIFGMSAQTAEDRIEAAQRLQLPYELLSDNALLFAQTLGLPVFEAGGMRLLKRVTVIVKNGTVAKYFYAVFPPDKNANEVLSWLRVHAV